MPNCHEKKIQKHSNCEENRIFTEKINLYFPHKAMSFTKHENRILIYLQCIFHVIKFSKYHHHFHIPVFQLSVKILFFLLSFIFSLWSFGMAKPIRWYGIFFLLINISLILLIFFLLHPSFSFIIFHVSLFFFNIFFFFLHCSFSTLFFLLYLPSFLSKLSSFFYSKFSFLFFFLSLLF